MKLAKPNMMEWMSFLILMPLIGAAMCFKLFGTEWYMHTQAWHGYFYMLCIALAPWYLDVVSVRLIHSQYPTYNTSGRRIAVLFIKICLIVFISCQMIIHGLDYWRIGGYYHKPGDLAWCFLIGFCLTNIATIIWEGDFIVKQWKESLAEQEKYEQLNLIMEFESLKSQVNPHFLFNCLNTLSALITMDKPQAENFLNELSKVYRYLLKNNETGLSNVKSEVEFIRSYFKLLKSRFDDALYFTIEIDPNLEECLLPSLSLQMLVENAVKHNALSKSKPLTVIISTQNKQLQITNNIQPLIKHVPSGKFGLKNINSKYDILKIPGFEVKNDSIYFTVELPLICN
ncbi:histidine kinase [soil metagenome]